MDEIRVLPSNRNLEMMVLGAMVRHGDTVPLGVSLITNEDVFYVPQHRYLFRAIVSLHGKGQPVDVATLANELEQLGLLQMSGGRTYLIDVCESVFTAGNLSYHAAILIDLYRRRQLAYEAGQLWVAATDQTIQMTELLVQYGKIGNVFGDDGHSELSVGPGQFVEARAKMEKLRRVDSGYTVLDRLLAEGFVPDTLSIIAGRTSTGKSSLRQNLTRNLCVRGLGVLCVATEPRFASESSRLLSVYSGIGYDAIRTVEDWRAADPDRALLIDNAAAEINEWNLHNEFSRGASLPDISLCISRVKRTWPLDVVFVDRFDLLREIRGAHEAFGKQAIIKDALQELLVISHRESVHICLLIQMRRGQGTAAANVKQYSRPTLDQLKEAGAFEDAADLVLFTHRPGWYDRNIPDTRIEVSIGKQREGPAGANCYVTMGFEGETRRVIELPEDENAGQGGD